MLVLDGDGLLQLGMCVCQLLLGQCHRLLHGPHQRLGSVDCLHSSIATVFWVRLLNGPDQSRMAVPGRRWRVHWWR